MKISWQFLVVLAFLIVFFWMRSCEASTELEVGRVFFKGTPSSYQVMCSETFDNKYSLGFGLISESTVVNKYFPMNMFVQAARHVNYKNFSLGLGVAYFEHTTPSLGQKLNFTEAIRYSITNNWFITYRHWSNAGQTSPNAGHDVLLLGYQW